jgi:hypothetical protein
MKKSAAGGKTKREACGSVHGAKKKAEKLVWEKKSVHHRVKQASKGQIS